MQIPSETLRGRGTGGRILKERERVENLNMKEGINKGNKGKKEGRKEKMKEGRKDRKRNGGRKEGRKEKRKEGKRN